MTMLYTGRLDYSGADRLDVTRQGADPLGRIFAPSWRLIGDAESALRRGTEHQAAVWRLYSGAYIGEMRESYRRHRQHWREMFAAEKWVLCCYCAAPAHCHRRLLALVLVRAAMCEGCREAGGQREGCEHCGAHYAGELGEVNQGELF